MNDSQTQAAEPMLTQADDFKLIRGIGPGIEKRLHKAKIRTYAQLSALTPEQVTDLLSDMIGMTLKRVVDQDWIGQARQLADQAEQVSPKEATPANGHMHYAIFTTELLLDEANNVRRTRILHVQSQSETAWAGWDATRLIGFFTKSADLKVTRLVTSSKGETSIENQGAVVKTEEKSQPTEFSGQLRLHELEIESEKTPGAHKLLFGDEPFIIRLTLDILDLNIPRNVPLNYSAVVYAKRVGQGSRQTVAKKEGKLLPLDRVDLELQGINLTRGIYRIDTFVELKAAPGADQPFMGQMAMTEGSVVQVI